MIVGGQREARAQLSSTIIDYHEPFHQGLKLHTVHIFRAEKRNKQARVLTVVLTMVGFSSIIQTNKVTNFVCFLNIPGKQQHFNLTNESWCIVFMGNHFFFFDRIILKMVFAPTNFPRYT